MNRRKQLRYNKKARAIEYLGGKCVTCGSAEKLEFDHVDNNREGKKHLVSQLINCNWDRVVKELEKCQLLCKSCHVKKSIIEKNYKLAEHGTSSMYTNQRCRCELCREAWRIYHRPYLLKYRKNKILKA